MSDMPELWELPDGWAWAEFQQVAKVASNLVDPGTFQDAPHIAPNHIESGTGKLLSYATVAEDGVKSAKHQFFAGHILYSKIRPYLCKAVVVDFDGLCSADMYPIASAIDTAYLHRWMLTRAFTEMTSKHEGRTLLPKINQEALALLSVPVAPLAEQHRIVAAVERVLEKVESAREKLERVPRTMKRFRQAVLAAACSGRLTADWREENTEDATEGERLEEAPIEGLILPSSWKWVRANSAFSFVTSGSRGWAKYYADSGAAFLRVGNLDHETIRLDMRSVQRVNPPSGAEGARTRVREGDVLITITAEPGMVALVDTDIGDAYVNQHVALARPTGQLDSRFLAYFLAARTTGQVQFEASQRGATKMGLGLDDIRNLWIASPPRSEQCKIVERIEELLAYADSIEQRATAALRRVEVLSQAILAKAFRGELVPTEAELARKEGRDYEPASELLARLKESVNGEAKRPRKKRTSKRASASGDGLLEFMEG